jgi:hypothetical protein
MARGPEYAYIGRANTIKRVLQSAAVDLTAPQQAAITRVTAGFGTYCIDTDVALDPISYADGTVEMQIGLVTGLTAGEYQVEITCYDAATPEGYAWGRFDLVVESWGACDV